MFKNKSTKIIILTVLLLFGLSSVAYAKTVIKWKPISVNEYWSRRITKFDSDVNTFFYRPLRFEKMNIDVRGYEEIQVKVITKEKTDLVHFNVYINGKAQSFTTKNTRNNESFYFFEPVTIKIPKDIQTFSIFTRNPNAYFRAFGKEVKIIKEIPSTIVLKGEAYKRIVTLLSSKTRSEYYIADSSTPVVFTAKYDGNLTTYIRFLPLVKKTKCKIDIYVNKVLVDSLELNQKISGEYSVNERKVSIGKKVTTSNIKKNDKIEFRVSSSHEVLIRSILKTGK